LDTSRYAQLFATESREHLSAINLALLELERTSGEQGTVPGSEEQRGAAIGTLFRAVHTIKGMSAAMGYDAVATLAHEMEALLDRMRRGELAPTATVIDALLRAADVLERGVDRAVSGAEDDGEAAATAAQLQSAAAGTGRRTMAVPVVDEPGGTAALADSVRRVGHVRIDLRRLDALMNLIGELVIARGRLVQLATAIADPALTETVALGGRLIGDLQDEIMTCRMVPVWQVFDRFPRLVRDAARLAGKEVGLDIEGTEIELDRSMLDEIGEPIVHLLRNAIDHGIEAPGDRVAAGKPREGRLVLSAQRDRSAVLIRVTDDGRGIDRAKVLARALEGGLVPPGTTTLSDEDMIRLIARPGFTTADRVTELSGRGVGIDAVQARVRALGGSLEIKTAPGQGTTVTARLPLTLAIMRALLTRVGEEAYAFPMVHVDETVQASGADMAAVRGQPVLVLRGDAIPYRRLRDIVALPGPSAPLSDPGEHVVILETQGQRVAVAVDELSGQQDIVVKQFDAPKGGGALFTGATILGDGAPALIVDVSSLL
jgi:two-component system chemotaxis sensor kinase CheA